MEYKQPNKHNNITSNVTMAESKVSDGTPKNTNKRKANEIPDLRPTNIALLVDLSIRKTSKPVTRQAMTQDLHNEILNSQKQVERSPGQVNNHENTSQQVTDAIQPSKRPRGRPRFGELQTCNARQPVQSTPKPRGRPQKEEKSTDGEGVDEIKDFYDCRYLSACEADWRIYGFDIHYRIPHVERLPFHLQDEKTVIFDATESIDYTLEKSLVNETKFVQRMELNKTDDFASTLLYAEIPKHYVWNAQKIIWDQRQRADSDLADLIRQEKLIIWDEAPMIPSYCSEAFDRTLRDIYRSDPSQPSNRVFGGKVVLFGGESTVVLPDEMLILESDDYVGLIIDETYPKLVQNLWNPTFFQERAILVPTHKMVDMINEREERVYESLDYVCLDDDETNFDESIYTTDFLKATSVKDGNKCNRSKSHIGRKGGQDLRSPIESLIILVVEYCLLVRLGLSDPYAHTFLEHHSIHQCCGSCVVGLSDVILSLIMSLKCEHRVVN
nr:hypothetical protein [Tanacetum cinerariifolium]